MKLKTILLPALLAALALASGCVAVTVAQTEGTNMITVQNEGCFLFGGIPLFTGDPNYPNEQVANWFENTLKVETNIRLLEEEASNRNARGFRSLSTEWNDESIFLFILKRKTCQTSAELLK